MGMWGDDGPKLGAMRGAQWFIAADHADALALHRMIGIDHAGRAG